MTFLHRCPFIILSPLLPSLIPIPSSVSRTIFQMRESKSYLSSWPSFILLTLIISSSICFPENDVIHSSWLNKTPLCVYTPFYLLSHWWHQGWFHILVTMNIAAVNIMKQILWLLKTQKKQEAFDPKSRLQRPFSSSPALSSNCELTITVFLPSHSNTHSLFDVLKLFHMGSLSPQALEICSYYLILRHASQVLLFVDVWWVTCPRFLLPFLILGLSASYAIYSIQFHSLHTPPRFVAFPIHVSLFSSKSELPAACSFSSEVTQSLRPNPVTLNAVTY